MTFPAMVDNACISPKPSSGISGKALKGLLNDVRQLIETTRSQVAQAVNVGLVMSNWHIGKRIRKDIIGQDRAEYGERIVSTLSRQLTLEYGRGYSRANLFHGVTMLKRAVALPADVFSKFEIALYIPVPDTSL